MQTTWEGRTQAWEEDQGRRGGLVTVAMSESAKSVQRENAATARQTEARTLDVRGRGRLGRRTATAEGAGGAVGGAGEGTGDTCDPEAQGQPLEEKGVATSREPCAADPGDRENGRDFTRMPLTLPKAVPGERQGRTRLHLSRSKSGVKVQPQVPSAASETPGGCGGGRRVGAQKLGVNAKGHEVMALSPIVSHRLGCQSHCQRMVQETYTVNKSVRRYSASLSTFTSVIKLSRAESWPLGENSPRRETVHYEENDKALPSVSGIRSGSAS